MRWESISTNSSNEVYQLSNNGKRVLTLTLHRFSNTARVECEEQKRVFLIRKEGFLRNKTVLRNEYGIKVGELGQENRENFIDVNNERFYYTINNNPMPELIIYKESKDKPALVCGLDIKNGNPSLRFKNDRKNLSSHPSLLMALCWYMFLPVAQENNIPVEVGSAL